MGLLCTTLAARARDLSQEDKDADVRLVHLYRGEL